MYWCDHNTSLQAAFLKNLPLKLGGSEMACMLMLVYYEDPVNITVDPVRQQRHKSCVRQQSLHASMHHRHIPVGLAQHVMDSCLYRT